MKDTIITAKQKKRELIVFLICFAVAFVLNIVGISIYNTSWSELVTGFFTVLLVSLFLYAITAAVRMLIYIFSRIVVRRS